MSYSCVLFVETESHVSPGVLTLTLQVHLELRSFCILTMGAKITSRQQTISWICYALNIHTGKC